MVATSFVDETFLQTLASLKKRSAGHQSGRTTAPASNGPKDAKNSWFQGPGIVGLHRFSGIHWDESYGLDSIQNVWNEFTPDSQKGSTPQAPSPAKKQEAGKVPDNVGTQRNSQQALEVLVNSVKIVLPTAMNAKNNVVQGKKLKKNSHFVVLDFADQGRGVKQIMDALDSISNAYYGRPFLSPTGDSVLAKAITEKSFASWSPNWLRTANKQPTNAESGDSSSPTTTTTTNVPMYAILFSRIESAIMASYFERVSHHAPKINGGAEAGVNSPNGRDQPAEKRYGDDVSTLKFVLSQRDRLASNNHLTQHKNDVILTKLFGVSDNKRMVDPVRFQASMLVMVPISMLITIALSAERTKAKPISMGEMNARFEAALGEARRGLSAALNNNGNAASAMVTNAPHRDVVSSPPASRFRGNAHQTPDSASVSSDQVVAGSGGSTARKRKKKKKKNKNKSQNATALSPNKTSGSPQNNLHGNMDRISPRKDEAPSPSVNFVANGNQGPPTGNDKAPQNVLTSRVDGDKDLPRSGDGVVEPANQTVSSVEEISSKNDNAQTARIPVPTPSGIDSAGGTVDEGSKDDEEWETVGTRSRGRKKVNDLGNNGNGESSRTDAQKRNKAEKKTPGSQKRKNNQSRKIAREILFSVLDGVEEELRSHDTPAPAADNSVTIPANHDELKERSSRPLEGKWNGDSQLGRQHHTSGNQVEMGQKKSSPADQSTAPTYQETVSAVSGGTDGERREAGKVAHKPHVTPARSGNGQIVDDIPRPEAERVQSTSSSNYQGKSFPLPTLLSPENANSTTSSVGSSLEAPHGHNHINASASAALDDNAVGFHLLDVCDRLSKDMSLFMKSRDHTVSVRRNERAVILGALQETVSGIWPNSCRVELYGSCATLLDLPSSDLDVVITGLDRSEGFWNSPDYGRSGDGTDDSYKPQPHGPSNPYIPVYSPNAHRVMKLSAEIERLPWAVKVKSIPNATVPVIKILADPSKISGALNNSDWVGPGYGSMQSEQFTETGESATASTELSLPSSTTHRTFQPWRGSDVMNGLISLDITFEGPEHGGIGSTEYSMHVVNQICQESGLRPEETPFVQSLMVLKELLAQRKLNEPYSGGLSSYALLLLMTALLRERAAIRAEIERSAQHRQTTMAVGVQGSTDSYSQGENQAPDVVPSDSTEVKESLDSKPESPVATRSGETAAQVTPASWASVARKTETTSGESTEDANSTTVCDSPGNDHQEPREGDRPKSFADAVSKTAPTTQLNQIRLQSNGNGEKNEEATGLTSTPTEASQSEFHAADDGRQFAMGSFDPNMGQSFFPQGFDDVIEVLCLGETTSGKLLMHFLLHYGQYFDATSTAIDVSGKHERALAITPYSYLTPYIERSTPESIDPHTGMLIIDHIVIYDPLEGREKNNVARRCFAWPHVRWIFAQSYATLSSAVEKASPAHGQHVWPEGTKSDQAQHSPGVEETVEPEVSGEQADPSSQLLMCLISF